MSTDDPISPRLLLKLYRDLGDPVDVADMLDAIADIDRLVQRLLAVAEDDLESEAGQACAQAAQFIIALSKEIADASKQKELF